MKLDIKFIEKRKFKKKMEKISQLTRKSFYLGNIKKNIMIDKVNVKEIS